MRRTLPILLTATLAACATTTQRRNLPPLETVPHVELSRYLGTWYEIASFPQSFQEGCTETTATYTLRPDGEIDVLNRCMRRGKLTEANGRARVVDRATNAKLEVSFFWPIWSDYWIVDLAPDYAWAVVGHPSRDYLWILSRAPELPIATYGEILNRLQSKGYEVERLQLTPQPPRPGENAPKPPPAQFESTEG